VKGLGYLLMFIAAVFVCSFLGVNVLYWAARAVNYMIQH
jgi:hypothetical protein